MARADPIAGRIEKALLPRVSLEGVREDWNTEMRLPGIRRLEAQHLRSKLTERSDRRLGRTICTRALNELGEKVQDALLERLQECRELHARFQFNSVTGYCIPIVIRNGLLGRPNDVGIVIYLRKLRLTSQQTKSRTGLTNITVSLSASYIISVPSGNEADKRQAQSNRTSTTGRPLRTTRD